MVDAVNHAPVVVGIDGAGSADDAVDWAAAEAATRGCRLHVVHAFHPAVPADPYGLIPPAGYLDTPSTAAEAMLRAAVGRARSVASDIEVSARLLTEAAAPVLLAEAGTAQLLVLGSRGLHGLRALLAGSVSVHVAAHASCPVVVIRGREVGHDLTWSPPRVVVGVDGEGSCDRAVGFAFHAARQRGIPLDATHVWTPDSPADLEAIHGAPATSEAFGLRTLDRALRPWRSRFPDVPVATTLVRGEPGRTLAAAARGAALLVVGSRGRGHLRSALLGSVSRWVLQHGHGPIAVVRHAGGAPGSTVDAIADHVPGSRDEQARRSKRRRHRPD